MQTKVLAVDIGGSHITSVMLSGELGDLSPSSPPRSLKVDAYQNAETILAAWSGHLKWDIQNAGPGFSGTLAIAMPGPFDYESGTALFEGATKFAALNGLNLRSYLRRTLIGCQSVYFENDAACFGLGAAWQLSKTGSRRVIAITLGTGIGSAFIVNGRLVKSGLGLPEGGEIYHLPFQNGIADDHFGTRWFISYVYKNFGIRINGVLDLLNQASPEITGQIFKVYAHQLAELLVPICQNFRPDSIAFGGNIALSYPLFAPAFAPYFDSSGLKILSLAEEGELLTCLGAGKIIS